MLPIALVLIFFLLLPCGGASVRPVHVFSDRATGTSADKQIGLSDGYIPELLMLLSNIKDAEQDNDIPFRGTLRDGDGPMKRQEKNVAQTPAEVFPMKQAKRKEGCKFFYYKTWTAC